MTDETMLLTYRIMARAKNRSWVHLVMGQSVDNFAGWDLTQHPKNGGKDSYVYSCDRIFARLTGV